MHMALRSTVAFLLMGSSAAFAAQTGGFATTDGGNVSGAKSFTARSHSEINSILPNLHHFGDGNGTLDYPLNLGFV